MDTPFSLGHFEASVGHLVTVAEYILEDIDAGDRPNPGQVADFRRQIERLRLMVQANTRTYRRTA